MKKLKLFIIVLFLVFLLFACKEREDQKDIEEISSNDTFIENPEVSLDFEMLEERVLSSERLDIDVFFAISALHKHFITELEKEVVSLPEEKQREFFKEKKEEFFDSIKYSEEEYVAFFEKINREDPNAMKNYLESNPELKSFLSSL